MPWVYIICFALIAAGLLTLFGVRPGDFIDALFRSQRKSATLTDELNVLMGTPAKGFFNQDFELKQILKGTGRADRYEAVKRLSLILFAVGGALALLIGNVYMVPILGIGFSLAPIWYLRSTAASYKKHLNEELETAISIITTSYGDYEPSVFKTQSEHQKQLNHNASMAEELLRQKMGNSPEAIAAFEAYQLAAGECSSIVAEQAFESGFQTAVQMLVAGLIPPENKFAAEVPLTTQELRKMDGEQVFCLDMNEEVRVVARKKGFIQVTNDKEIHLITGLTLYRHRPSWCQ